MQLKILIARLIAIKIFNRIAALLFLLKLLVLSVSVVQIEKTQELIDVCTADPLSNMRNSVTVCMFGLADISSIKDLSQRVKELGTKARLYEPSLAKASGHLQRLGPENDKERSDTCLSLFLIGWPGCVGLAG